MPVFDNTPKIETRVKDPGTDKKLSEGGALSYPAITAPTGLAGCTGVDAKLVQGDRWQQLGGNLTTNISQNDKLLVQSNQTHTITGNHTKTIVGNVNHTVVGSQNSLQVGAENSVKVSAHSRLNSADDSQAEPTNKMRIFGVDFEKKDQESTITMNKMEIVIMDNAVTVVKNEVNGLSVEHTVIGLATTGFSVEPKIVEVELKALKTIGEGAEAKLAGGTAAVSPSVNAVPHVPTMGGH